MTVKRGILVIGIELITLMLLVIGVYVWMEKEKEIQPVAYPEEVQEEVTLEGYEEANVLLEYMIYQIKEQNLDYALRGCAFKDIAECFCLDYYTEYLERFENVELIPPSDADSPAYLALASARLSAGYARALTQLMDIFKENDLRLLEIAEDVPDNPDGLYYESRKQICKILGARSLEEKIVYFRIGEQTKELHCTLVRYRKYWKILFFHSLQDVSIDVVDLKDSAFNGISIMSLDSYAKDILPCNYYLLNDNREDDPITVIERFFLYLQREDAQSAMSYMDIYENNEKLYELLEKQGQIAYMVQEFYYCTLLHDKEYIEWIFKDIVERGADLTKALSTTNMLFTKIERLDEIQNDGKTAEYDLYWSYEEVWFKGKIFLQNREGWKITEIVYGW